MRYVVIKPWMGVQAGEVIQREKLHPALKAHVRPLKEEPELVTADVKMPSKGDVAKRLKELGIQFDGRAAVADLVQLLPEDELAALQSPD